MEACFAARFPQEDTGRGAPSDQEFIAKTTQELKDARPCAAIAAHLARLPIQARMAGCASALTSQGSTGPHLRSSFGLRAWDVARAHFTATFTCHPACRAWHPPSNATYGVSWRVRRPGITQSWRRWRRSSRYRPDPQSLPRLRASVAREEHPFTTHLQLPQHPFDNGTR